MPWSGAEFRAKHWNAASPPQAKKAASIANAMLRGGADEGVAIATAIRRCKMMRRKK